MHKLEQLFDNLLVLEFASALAGPLVGTFMKELGARVIKIEPPNGDVSRKWRLKGEATNKAESYYYCAANGNKESRKINLKEESSQEDLSPLLEQADVIITNFSSARAMRYGLDYAALLKINSKVILANITGFGPELERPAFDVLLQAECGLMAMTGFPDRSPTRFPLPIVDILSGHQLKQAVLCALLKLAKTGQGSEVQVSLYDSTLSALTNVGSNYLMGNVVAQPSGTEHPSIAPYGDIYTTQDHQTFILAIGSDAQFTRLCQVLALPEVATSTKFRENKNRVIHRSELNRLLQRIFIEEHLSHWINLFSQMGIPGGSVKSIDTVLSEEAAQKNILAEPLPNGTISRRTRQVVFI